MTIAVFRGKPDARNPHVRFDEGEVTSVKPRCGSPLFNRMAVRLSVLSGMLCVASALQAADTDMIYDSSHPMGLMYLTPDYYVQDGLISMFDGEFNAGRDAAHDNAATAWANLVEGAPDAVFRTSTASEADASAAGTWLANGYCFDAANYAVMSAGAGEVTNFTVQLTGNFDTTQQPVPPDDATLNYYPNFLSNKDDFGFFIQNNKGQDPSKTIQWKCEVFGQVEKSRPMIGNWSGRFISGGMDATNIYMAVGEQWEKTKTKERTKHEEIPAIAWCWGGCVCSSSQATIRYARGTVHAVRIYDRCLSDDELAHNCAIDNIRFFQAPLPSTNVVVTTSIGELPATGCGLFAVNGCYDFAAPPNYTERELTFACTGYQLEFWNQLSNFWEKAEMFTGQTYAYTNTLATAKVRLTWQMTPIAGVRHYAADAYVTNGLLLHFDGILNAGLNQPQNPAATVWKNLVPDSPDAELGRLEGGAAGEWRANGYWCSGCEWWRQIASIYAGATLTVQASTTYVRGEQAPASDKYKTKEGNDEYYPSVFGTVADNCNLFSTQNGGTLYLKADSVTGNPSGSGGRSRFSWSGKNVTALLDYSRTAAFQNVPESVTWREEGVFTMPVGEQRFCLGGVPKVNWEAQRSMKGMLHAVRLYGRLLTKDEVEWNLDLDNVRFRGALPALASNVVEVVKGDPSAEAPVDYYRLYGSYTFTAPAAVTNAAGAVWVCTGYALERFDAETLQYLGAETFEGTSCTLTSDDTTPRRRLTWLWRIEAGLKRVADFDVGDYVQLDLVGHWDGIRNVGADQPHDNAAEEWADLSYRHVPLTLRGANVDSGYWEEDGYHLMQESYWYMSETVTLGLAFTLQQVTDIEFSSHTNRYPNYFGIYGDNGLYTQNANSQLTWKFDNYGSTSDTRSKLANWGGKFITTACDDQNMYLTDTVTYGTPTARTKFEKVGARQWSFGAASGNSAPSRYSQGTYKAMRLYSRKLTEEELAWNRLVDEARFNHVLVQTNVVVATSRPETVGTEAAGEYLVQGSWNFTAPVRREADGIKYTPVGYTLETWANGAWGAPESFTGTNYVHDATVQTAPVRLTWQWKRSGSLVISFR